MPEEIKYYTRKTIEAWDEAAPIHAAINASLSTRVKRPDFNNLNPDFDALIDTCGVRGKSVIQVCCNNGIDLLSVKNKGAGRCLGIDGSKAFIEQATGLAALAGHPDIEYRCSDIYDAAGAGIGAFDIVMTTVGVLGWMPDLDRFMNTCASFLVPGGVFLMEELHPVLGMYEEGSPSYIKYSYFDEEPSRDTGGLDYFTHKKYAAKENYFFPHTLSRVLMSAIDNGLGLEHVREISYNIGNYCADLEFAQANPPLGINLAWRKTG